MGDNADQIFEAHGGYNSLEATYRRGMLNVSVENPWAGCTETGFGSTCYVNLSKDDMVRFAEWMLVMTKR